MRNPLREEPVGWLLAHDFFQAIQFQKEVSFNGCPSEDARVSIATAAETMTFSRAFRLVAAMNPCPCVYFGDPVRECRCSPAQVERYRAKISHRSEVLLLPSKKRPNPSSRQNVTECSDYSIVRAFPKAVFTAAGTCQFVGEPFLFEEAAESLRDFVVASEF